jgi:hypothetical protein
MMVCFVISQVLHNFAMLASNSRKYSYSKIDSPLSTIWRVADTAYHGISDTESRQLPVQYKWFGESPTPRITVSPIRGFAYWVFLSRKLSVSVYQVPCRTSRCWLLIRANIRILKSTPIYQQYGESPSPRISDVCEFEAKKLRLLHFY